MMHVLLVGVTCGAHMQLVVQLTGGTSLNKSAVHPQLRYNVSEPHFFRQPASNDCISRSQQFLVYHDAQTGTKIVRKTYNSSSIKSIFYTTLTTKRYSSRRLHAIAPVDSPNRNFLRLLGTIWSSDDFSPESRMVRLLLLSQPQQQLMPHRNCSRQPLHPAPLSCLQVLRRPAPATLNHLPAMHNKFVQSPCMCCSSPMQPTEAYLDLTFKLAINSAFELSNYGKKPQPKV